MKLILAADHGGFELKNQVAAALRHAGHTMEDMGVHTKDSVDYPRIAESAVRRYFAEGFDFGVLFCGTGIGISIAANKMHGVRCALVHDAFTAEMARAHNHANFLAFGGRIQYPVPVAELIEIFMKTPPMGDRHERRVAQLQALDDAN